MHPSLCKMCHRIDRGLETRLFGKSQSFSMSSLHSHMYFLGSSTVSAARYDLMSRFQVSLSLSASLGSTSCFRPFYCLFSVVYRLRREMCVRAR